MPHHKDTYETPPLEEIASPVNLSSLIEEAKADERLKKILVEWADESRRDAMQEDAIAFIKDHIRFQARTENSVYAATYGPKGSGKNEIVTMLAIWTIEIFKEDAGIDLKLKFARKPSEANLLFSEEIRGGNTVMMVLDERETEFGPDSQKEFMALVQLADTMREQRHCLYMCAITRGELGKLLSRCELILRPIFSDRKNRINWCILYINDLHAKSIVPKTIVGIPLHKYDWLRRAYKKSKRERQREIGELGGRSGVDNIRIVDMSEQLRQYFIEHGLEAKVKTLKEVLLTDIQGGRMLGDEEREAIVSRAHRLLNGGSTGPGPSRRSEDIVIAWVGDRFDWKQKVHTSLVDGDASHKFKREYADVWYATEVEGLALYRDQEKVEQLIGMQYQQAWRWSKKMEKDKEFQGWVAYYRGEVLFEDYLANRFRAFGWNVATKPTIEINGVVYEEDMMIEVNGEQVYINAKCGLGYRQYVCKEYDTSHKIATELSQRAYVVYFDYVTEVFSVYDAAQEAFNVGSEQTRSLEWAQKEVKKQRLEKRGVDRPLEFFHSTPFSLGAVLNNLVKVPSRDVPDGPQECEEHVDTDVGVADRGGV